ncbi:MAG TPA: gamma-glutamylcyclotransferase family protein, partial [Thermomicrobiales bacterium]
MVVEPNQCFVYGTLKRGQSNYPLIAASVREARPATIRGRLYDVGPFPALAHGDEAIHGELLLIVPEALAGVLVVLDDLEGYDA